MRKVLSLVARISMVRGSCARNAGCEQYAEQEQHAEILHFGFFMSVLLIALQKVLVDGLGIASRKIGLYPHVPHDGVGLTR